MRLVRVVSGVVLCLSAVVALIAVQSGGSAGFIGRSNHHHIARDRHRAAEEIIRLGVGGFEVSLLNPVRPDAFEDISGAGRLGAVIVGVSVHAGGIAGFKTGPADQRIARYCHGEAEVIAGPAAGGFQVSLLTPVRPVA